MRSQFAGTCYRCKKHIEPGDGHFERFNGGWRMQHATCAIQYRGLGDPDRSAQQHKQLMINAQGTGKRAQRARQTLARQNAAIRVEEF